MTTRTFAPLAAALLAGGLASCIASTSDTTTGSLTIDNESSYALAEVHVTGVGSRSWGPNLTPETLQPGEQVEVDTVDCASYDVLVVDELGTSCVLSSLNLCFKDQVWVIDDGTLASCAFQ